MPLPRSLNPEGRGLVSLYGGTVIQLAIRKHPDGFAPARHKSKYHFPYVRLAAVGRW